MKIGVDPGNLSDVDRKLVEAAAIAHKATGIPIASHTGDGVAAHQELDVLDLRACRSTPSSGYTRTAKATTAR